MATQESVGLKGKWTLTKKSNGDIRIQLSWYINSSSDLSRMISKSEKIWDSHEAVKVVVVIDYGELWMYQFFSRVMTNKNAFNAMTKDESKMLKGLAYSSLCKILNFLLNEKLVTLDQEMFINAMNNRFDTKDSRKLVTMYETLGFKVSDPDSLEEQIMTNIVDMTSTVGELLAKCKQRSIHDLEQYKFT